MKKYFKNKEDALKSWKSKILYEKLKFDIGYGLSSYIKLALALFGLSSLNVRATMILVIVYGIFCYVFGWAWIKFGWYEANMELGNQFNFFVREMRKKRKV